MECPKCKLNISDGSSFCPYCGAKFHDAAKREQVKAQKRKEAGEAHRRDEAKRAREESDLDKVEREAIEREKRRDKESIEVDPDKIRLYDRPADDYDDDAYGHGGFGGGGMFGDFFGGGSIFGNIFGGGGRKQSRGFGFGGGGLFDIIESFFGGGYGGGRQEQKRLKAEDDFFYREPEDEDGIPVLYEDEVIDISNRELERRVKEWDKKNKNDKKNSK